MDTVEEEDDFNYTEASNAFGATEFATVLSNNLNAHDTVPQNILGNHGLVRKYQRIAQEKYRALKSKVINI
jgi:hypothetical protein